MNGFQDQLIDEVFGLRFLQVLEGQGKVSPLVFQTSFIEAHAAFPVLCRQVLLVLINEGGDGLKIFQSEAKAYDIVEGEARHLPVFNVNIRTQAGLIQLPSFTGKAQTSFIELANTEIGSCPVEVFQLVLGKLFLMKL